MAGAVLSTLLGQKCHIACCERSVRELRPCLPNALVAPVSFLTIAPSAPTAGRRTPWRSPTSPRRLRRKLRWRPAAKRRVARRRAAQAPVAVRGSCDASSAARSSLARAWFWPPATAARLTNATRATVWAARAVATRAPAAFRREVARREVLRPAAARPEARRPPAAALVRAAWVVRLGLAETSRPECSAFPGRLPMGGSLGRQCGRGGRAVAAVLSAGPLVMGPRWLRSSWRWMERMECT